MRASGRSRVRIATSPSRSRRRSSKLTARSAATRPAPARARRGTRRGRTSRRARGAAVAAPRSAPTSAVRPGEAVAPQERGGRRRVAGCAREAPRGAQPAAEEERGAAGQQHREHAELVEAEDVHGDGAPGRERLAAEEGRASARRRRGTARRGPPRPASRAHGGRVSPRRAQRDRRGREPRDHGHVEQGPAPVDHLGVHDAAFYSGARGAAPLVWPAHARRRAAQRAPREVLLLAPVAPALPRATSSAVSTRSFRNVVLCNRVENLERFARPDIVCLKSRALLQPAAAAICAADLRSRFAPALLHGHFGWSGARLLLLKALPAGPARDDLRRARRRRPAPRPAQRAALPDPARRLRPRSCASRTTCARRCSPPARRPSGRWSCTGASTSRASRFGSVPGARRGARSAC